MAATRSDRFESAEIAPRPSVVVESQQNANVRRRHRCDGAIAKAKGRPRRVRPRCHGKLMKIALKWPVESDQVTLANWRTAPYIKWAFQNVREIAPSADIANSPMQHHPRPTRRPNGGFASATIQRQSMGVAGHNDWRATVDEDGQYCFAVAL
jgi:hypothetical protein